jgi:hypothetical protein
MEGGQVGRYEGMKERRKEEGKYGRNIKGDFLDFFLFKYDTPHCFICRPSDSTVSEDAGIEPRTVETTASI